MAKKNRPPHIRPPAGYLLLSLDDLVEALKALRLEARPRRTNSRRRRRRRVVALALFVLSVGT
jgi:hypothetical protein